MRFLILSQYYPPEVGAAQIRLRAIAQHLSAEGHHVHVVTALPNYPEGRFAESDRRTIARRETIDGISVTRMWLLPATGAGVRRLANYLSFTLTGLAGALSRPTFDVIFIESPPLFLGASGWLAGRLRGSFVVLNVSDLWPDSVRDLGILSDGLLLRGSFAMENWLYRHVDAVTAVTYGIRDRLIHDKGVPERKVMMLPNGVGAHQLQFLKPVERQHRPRFVYAGNHGYAQGLDVLLDAASLAPEIDWVMVGSGSEKARLRARAAEMRLSNVQFAPPVPTTDVPGIYARAYGGVASLMDTELMRGARPAKLLAIMACGRPVLFSGAGEAAELVRRAGAGIVSPPGDGGALAAAARTLVRNPTLADKYGASGRRFVINELSWDTIVRDWLRHLEDLRNGR